jgi:ribose 5-phosphate isomerase B
MTYDLAVRIVLGSDEESPLLDRLEAVLLQRGHEAKWLARGDPWPEVGRRVGVAVADGQADRGVVCCWTGTGVSIAANKVPGVRAALCVDAQIAAGARRWNDANVLALSLAITSEDAVEEILDAFLETQPEPEEFANISMLEEQE